MATVTITRDYDGHFTAYRDGVKTGHYIVNGSRGLSGRDTRNMYGIVKPDGAVKWIGSLASAKKMLTYWLTRAEKAA